MFTGVDIGLMIVIGKLIVAAAVYVAINRNEIKHINDKIAELDDMKTCLNEIKTLLARIDERIKTIERENREK